MQTKKMSSPSASASPSAVSFVDPKLKQVRDEALLREHLNNTLSQVADSDRLLLLKSSVTKLVGQVLQQELSHEALVDLFAETYANLLDSYKQVELTESEQVTAYVNATGQVMSVDHAINTFQDIYRVEAFIRGVHKAIESKKDQEQVHIVYPACGPFAPLLLPLIGHYSSQHTGHNQLKITLIDIQPGAVKVLNELVNDLGVSPYIHEIVCCDVMDYAPDHKIDILVMEALQHGFTREGHLSFARHLVPFLSDDAIMVPEKISVSASLNVGQREYVDQWLDQERTHSSLVNEEIQKERTPLGEIFALTLDKLRNLTVLPLGDSMELVECNQIRIPTGISNIEKTSLLFSVTAQVFGDEQINEYDSGITQPHMDQSICIDFEPDAASAEPDDLLVRSGDRIQFYYKLNGAPGFLPTVA